MGLKIGNKTRESFARYNSLSSKFVSVLTGLSKMKYMKSGQSRRRVMGNRRNLNRSGERSRGMRRKGRRGSREMSREGKMERTREGT